MKCYDTDNNILKLTQWDSNRVLVVKDLSFDGALEFQYYNDKSDKAAVVIPTILENEIQCKIPNLFLEVARVLTVVIVEKESTTETKAIAKIELPVERKKKPDSYHFVDDPDIVDWVQITDEARNLIADLKVQQEATETTRTETEKVRIETDKIGQQILNDANSGKFNAEPPRVGENGMWETFIDGQWVSTGVSAIHVSAGENTAIAEDEKGNKVITVKTTNSAEKDNTLPITSSAVYTQIGNIDALLETI